MMGRANGRTCQCCDDGQSPRAQRTSERRDWMRDQLVSDLYDATGIYLDEECE